MNNIKYIFIFLYVVLLPACAFKHQDLGPALGTPQLLADSFIAVDGKRLAQTTWVPSDNPDPAAWAVVVAVHGFNDYRHAFDDPAQWLASEGVVVVAYDQRGFGEDENAGFWAKKEVLASDLNTTISLARAEYPGLPVFVMGESMGGAVALYTLTGRENAADGLILVAPAVWGWRPSNIITKPALWLTARLMPGKKFSGRTLKLDPSDNYDVLVEMSKDPKVIKKTRIDAVVGLSRMMKHGMKSARGIRIPTLQVYGKKDDLVPAKMFRRLLKRLPVEHTTAIAYENGYHLLLRGCERAEVWRDILDFIAHEAGHALEESTLPPENACQSSSSSE